MGYFNLGDPAIWALAVAAHILTALIREIAQGPKPQRYHFFVEGIEFAQGRNVGDFVAKQIDIPLEGTLHRHHAADVHDAPQRADGSVHYWTVRMTTASLEPFSTMTAVPKPTFSPRRRPPVPVDGSVTPAITVRDFRFSYGKREVLTGITFDIPRRAVTAIIGPSGCGKSTFLRSINRLNDLIPGARPEGDIVVHGQSVYAASVDLVTMRQRIGMVFQRPNPFPKSIFDNVAYGPRLNGLVSRNELPALVERCLRRAALWDEVKDRLNAPATGLSGGQQQRLCIARALGNSPEVLLMDEPCSALDPIATAIIEELIDELRENFTIVIVTHSMQQAARVSQKTAFFHLGKLIEEGATSDIFTNPKNKQTQDYITGRIG